MNPRLDDELADKLDAEAREYAADAKIRRINALRFDRAMSGPPGEPPEYLCEGCGSEDCICVDDESEDQKLRERIILEAHHDAVASMTERKSA